MRRIKPKLRSPESGVEHRGSPGAESNTERENRLPFAVRSLVLPLLILAGVASLWAGEEPGENAPPDAKQIQAAIDGGLKWLAARQIKDGPETGSWESPRYQAASASLAGLAFLANGYPPGKGEYGAVIERAMKYVRASMSAEGYVGAKDNSMYVHAIGTLFGLSYLGMSERPEKERELAEWCRRAINLILAAQKVQKRSFEQGGWRYSPYSTDSDVSVTSWQLLVLHSARQCGYEIEDGVFRSALKYINSAYVETDEGNGFVYRPGVSKSPELAVTGVAVFIKSLLEREEDQRLKKSLEFLRTTPPSWGGKQYKGYFFFGTFYMAQGMFQLGEEAWADFAPKIQHILLAHQEGDGHWEFPPDNKLQGRLAGLSYPTAMGVLILSLDKQYLPMYQRQKRLF